MPMQTQQQSRIPLGLQAVFLASNRGKEVNKPPPERSAAKTFTRSWMFQGLKRGGKSRRTKGTRSKEERPQKVKQFSSSISDTSHTSVLTDEEEPVAKIKNNKIETIIQQPAPKPKVSLSRRRFLTNALNVPRDLTYLISLHCCSLPLALL